MKTNDVDRLLTSFFELDAPRHEPDDLLPRVLTITRRRRPTPSWRATLRGSPMTTRTGPLRASTTRGLAVALLLIAALAALAVAAVFVGSRPSVVAPVAPTAAPTVPAVAPSARLSPSASPSATAIRTFTTPVWTMTYVDSLSWIVDGSDIDRYFGHVSEPVGVAVGTLEAAVRPSSIYVTDPDLDRSVKTTVAGYLAWLDTHPKLNVTDPIDVTVGGRAAKQVDVTLKPGENYAQGSTPSRLGIAWFGEGTTAIGPTNGETHRLNLIAIGGRTVIVDIASTNPGGTFRIAEEMVGTFQFAEGS